MSKIRLSRLLAVQAVVLGVFVMTFAQAASAFLGEMKNEGTGLCMTSLGTHTKGAPAEQWTCNGSVNQQWISSTEPFGGNLLINEGDGWCLNNRAGGASNNNNQIMWRCPGTPVFNMEYLTSGGGPNGSFKMAADGSNFKPNGYCVTSDGNKTVGSSVNEFSCNSSPNQYWSGPVIIEQ